MVAGKPWQNGDNESFNGPVWWECPAAERFHRLLEAWVVIEAWQWNITNAPIVSWAMTPLRWPMRAG
ncbi:MAG: hypothetical protein E4H32_08980 [Nitrospirales bacterium]|nr:MAG: hypothetical protein E4H32_08980 [Nitrospirales bacterium]